MPTYIDGIAASENIDTAGERISVAGMDISSLAETGVFNYEHKSEHPDQVIGKVLTAKKIFSEKDCEDDRQLYYWNKCQTPYVYVMGELFDDYKESAREVAGMFKYDNDKRDQNKRNVMNFSIEGAKISKEGINIVKSIARKVTITVLPANHAAVAEMVPNKTAKPKDDIDGLFKTETVVEIELFKTEDMGAFLENLKKSANLSLAKPADPRGTHMGKTKSGKDIHSHEKVYNYKDFSSHDHNDAMNMHYNAISTAKTPKEAQHHTNKMKLHMQAAGSAEKRETRLSGVKSGTVKGGVSTEKIHTSVQRPYAKVDNLKKATTAGGMGGAPSTLTGGAALAKESLEKGDPKTESAKGDKAWPQNNPSGNGMKQKGVHHEYDARGQSMAGLVNSSGAKEDKHHVTSMHRTKLAELKSMPKPNLTKTLKKSEFWLSRAEQEYATWDLRESFVKFMSEKNPSMTKTEIDVMGQTIALKKAIEAEEALATLVSDFEELEKAEAAIGTTRSGKAIHADKPASTYKTFSQEDHHDAAVAHAIHNKGNSLQRFSQHANAAGIKHNGRASFEKEAHAHNEKHGITGHTGKAKNSTQSASMQRLASDSASFDAAIKKK